MARPARRPGFLIDKEGIPEFAVLIKNCFDLLLLFRGI
jgi:hypothetical protein